MFRKLKEALIGVWSDDRDPNAPLRRERADMNRRVANLVERAIVSGAYAGPRLADDGFMCIVLSNTVDDIEAAKVARERIMHRIYPKVSLVSYLVEHDELDLTDDQFTMRIHASNWYWKFVNEQRGHADRLEQNCCPFQFNKVL
jgi:hypothetical protein